MEHFRLGRHARGICALTVRGLFSPPGPFVPKITAPCTSASASFRARSCPSCLGGKVAPLSRASFDQRAITATDGRALFELFERVKKQYDDDIEDSEDSGDEDEKMPDAPVMAMGEVYIKADSDAQSCGQEERIETPGDANGDVSVKQEIQIVGVDVDAGALRRSADDGRRAHGGLGKKQPISEDDLRILIKVDIIVGTQNLSDTFEWDLNSSVTPEEFAECYTKELGLSSEFT